MFQLHHRCAGSCTYVNTFSSFIIGGAIIHRIPLGINVVYFHPTTTTNPLTTTASTTSKSTCHSGWVFNVRNDGPIGHDTQMSTLANLVLWKYWSKGLLLLTYLLFCVHWNTTIGIPKWTRLIRIISTMHMVSIICVVHRQPIVAFMFVAVEWIIGSPSRITIVKVVGIIGRCCLWKIGNFCYLL